MNKTKQSEINARAYLLYFPPPPIKIPKQGTVRVQQLKRVVDPVARLYAKYFGKRNNKNIEITPYNYNEEALKYSLTAFQATNLATNIARRVPLEKFTVIELRPLVGTTSLALLDRPEIEFLIASEFQYAREFNTNIDAYGFEKKCIRLDTIKSFEGNRQFEGQVAVVHLDPGSDNLSQGMRLIDLLPELAKVFTMIFVQIDKLPPMKNFKYDVTTINIGEVESEKKGRGKGETVPFTVIFSETGLSKAKAKGMKIRDLRVDRKEWTKKQLDDLKVFLLKLLPKFGIKQKVEDFVNDKAMETWKAIFTEKSIDPTPGKNYEALETFGDGILEGLFTIYLHEQLPEITPEQSTLLFQRYMSKFLQPEYAEFLGIDKYLRIEVMYRKAKEDLFEAFVAGIYIISKDVYGRRGAGFEFSYNMLDYIFANKEKYNWKEISKGELKQSKTIIKERLDALYLRDKAVSRHVGNTIVSSIYISQKEALDLFRQIGITIPADLVIGTATIAGNNKALAENTAYENAIKFLDSQGFTRARADEENKKLKGVDPSVEKFGNEITDRKTELGLIAVYFIINPTTCRIVLYGVKAGTYTRIILADATDCDFDNGKRRAISAWLGYNK
jgi:dsRNA-specific ribonuclease